MVVVALLQKRLVTYFGLLVRRELSGVVCNHQEVQVALKRKSRGVETMMMKNGQAGTYTDYYYIRHEMWVGEDNEEER